MESDYNEFFSVLGTFRGGGIHSGRLCTEFQPGAYVKYRFMNNNCIGVFTKFQEGLTGSTEVVLFHLDLEIPIILTKEDVSLCQVEDLI